MPSVTINVTPRALLIILILSALFGGSYGSYKYGFKQGVQSAVDYFLSNSTSLGRSKDKESL